MTDEPIAFADAEWIVSTRTDAVTLAREVARLRGVETSLRGRVRVLTEQRDGRRDEVARLRDGIEALAVEMDEAGWGWFASRLRAFLAPTTEGQP